MDASETVSDGDGSAFWSRLVRLARPAVRRGGSGGGRGLTLWRAAAVVGLAVAAVLPVASASAQSSGVNDEVLVSNTGVTAAGVGSALWTQDLAQDFTTGSNAAGYTLSSIEISITTIGANIDVPSVTLVSGSASATDGTSLTGPASLTADTTQLYTFTAPSGTTLSSSTQYWIVVSHAGSSGADVRLNVTDSASSQAASETVAAAGWSIGDYTWARGLNSTGEYQWGGQVEPGSSSGRTLDPSQAHLLSVTGAAVGGI